MARVRRVLGAVSVEIAARRRRCDHDRQKHSVEKGQACLVIKDAAGGGSKNYCVQCGQEILDQAADDLEALRKQLS